MTKVCQWGITFVMDKGLPVGQNLRHGLEKTYKGFSTSSTVFYSFVNLLLPTLSIFSAGFRHQRRGLAEKIERVGMSRLENGLKMVELVLKHFVCFF